MLSASGVVRPSFYLEFDLARFLPDKKTLNSSFCHVSLIDEPLWIKKFLRWFPTILVSGKVPENLDMICKYRVKNSSSFAIYSHTQTWILSINNMVISQDFTSRNGNRSWTTEYASIFENSRLWMRAV
jgi:hypothetical protein